MKPHQYLVHASVPGEVVETFIQDGQMRARIALKPCCVEVLVEPEEDVQLRDHVTVDLRISVRHVADVGPKEDAPDPRFSRCPLCIEGFQLHPQEGEPTPNSPPQGRNKRVRSPRRSR